MKSLRETLVLGVLALVPAAVAVMLHPALADRARAGLETDEVRLTDVRDWGADVIWLDAREPDEFAQDHIPGAVAFDPVDFDRNLGAMLEVWEPGRRLVVYCGSESCSTSREIAARLRDAGFENVFYLRGGWDAWLEARR